MGVTWYRLVAEVIAALGSWSRATLKLTTFLIAEPSLAMAA